MSATPPQASPAGRLFTMQIIAASLVAGAGLCLGVMVLLRQQGAAPPPADPPVLTYVAVVMAVAMLAAHLVVPGAVVSAGLRRLSESRPPGGPPADLLGLYQAGLIVRLALLESAALMGAITYFLEGTTVSLVVSLVLIAVMALHFPTAGRVARWVEARSV
jgi:hypothetical protein